MKRRIRQNLWGNWNGYLGTRKVIEFGTSERKAREWMADPQTYENERLAELASRPVLRIPGYW